MNNDWWKIIPKNEQTTEILIDYDLRKLHFFTNRKEVAKRLKKRVGEPDTVETEQGMIIGVSYTRQLDSNDIKPFLSMTTLISTFRLKK